MKIQFLIGLFLYQSVWATVIFHHKGQLANDIKLFEVHAEVDLSKIWNELKSLKELPQTVRNYVKKFNDKGIMEMITLRLERSILSIEEKFVNLQNLIGNTQDQENDREKRQLLTSIGLVTIGSFLVN
jgi:hypothetical protein